MFYICLAREVCCSGAEGIAWSFDCNCSKGYALAHSPKLSVSEFISGTVRSIFNSYSQ